MNTSLQASALQDLLYEDFYETISVMIVATIHVSLHMAQMPQSEFQFNLMYSLRDVI